MYRNDSSVKVNLIMNYKSLLMQIGILFTQLDRASSGVVVMAEEFMDVN